MTDVKNVHKIYSGYHGISIVTLIERVGLAESRSEAKRLVHQGAVKVGDSVIDSHLISYIPGEEGVVMVERKTTTAIASFIVKSKEEEHEDKLREKLAELCHEQWSQWMEYLYGKCDNTISIYATEGKTQAIIPKEFTARWYRQMNTSYEGLSEEEKESDRREADKFMKLLKEFFKE